MLRKMECATMKRGYGCKTMDVVHFQFKFSSTVRSTGMTVMGSDPGWTDGRRGDRQVERQLHFCLYLFGAGISGIPSSHHVCPTLATVSPPFKHNVNLSVVSSGAFLKFAVLAAARTDALVQHTNVTAFLVSTFRDNMMRRRCPPYSRRLTSVS